MELPALAKEVHGGAKAGVFLIYGAEALLREEAAATIRSAEPPPGFQVLRSAGSDTSWPALADELYTPAFLGGRKLVLLADEGNFVHNHLAALKEYAANPSESAVLVALIPSDKAPGIPEGKSVRHVRCGAPKGPELVRWVQAELQRRGAQADRAVAEHLARHGGTTLLEISRRIETLALFGAGRRIGIDDATELVRAEPAHEVYELALAAAAKQTGKALEIAHRLLEAGEPPTLLIWRLAWQYRKLVEARKLMDAGRRRFEITSTLQITYYPDEFLALVDRHPLPELLEKHGQILATDLALKSTGADERVLIESLVLRLASERAAARAS